MENIITEELNRLEMLKAAALTDDPSLGYSKEIPVTWDLSPDESSSEMEVVPNNDNEARVIDIAILSKSGFFPPAVCFVGTGSRRKAYQQYLTRKLEGTIKMVENLGQGSALLSQTDISFIREACEFCLLFNDLSTVTWFTPKYHHKLKCSPMQLYQIDINKSIRLCLAPYSDFFTNAAPYYLGRNHHRFTKPQQKDDSAVAS